ncbi:MAG: methyltransferase [Chlorobi bacterium]|nr:methyltransferase [Chlorobiota bacterium]
MSNKWFAFKQFTIRQEHSAMKVTTDGVIFGAWIKPPLQGNILDIGSGTGLLALMMAQKTGAEIVALEPDTGSFKELKDNIAASPWPDRIVACNETLAQFCKNESVSGSFNLIISNPPYFENARLPMNETSSAARHTVALSHEDLLDCTGKLLSPGGKLSVILPVESGEKFIYRALWQQLYCNEMMDVYPSDVKPANRCLMIFEREKKGLRKKKLFVRKGIAYSSEYIALTKDYYLSVGNPTA